MTQEERLEGSKLIAEIMKLDYSKLCEIPVLVKDQQEDDFKFHSSWVWLMSVVEKIESMSNYVFYGKISKQINEHFDFPFLKGKQKYSEDVNVSFEINGRHIKLSVFEYMPTIDYVEFKENGYFNFDSSAIAEIDKKNPKTWRSKLDNTWLAVVEFIKWYNEQTKE